MNANSTHLDLEDLIAEANGQAVSDQAREHLAGCAECQLEASRWNLVAGGIRDLADDVTEEPKRARPARSGRRRGLTRTSQRAAGGGGRAAAAFSLLVGIGSWAGVVSISFGSGSGPGATTLLSAVSGCPQLEQAAGTLAGVSGSNVIIQTASGQLVTVTTTSASALNASGALLADVTDGATVLVTGTRSGGAIAADYVVVGGDPSLSVPGYLTVRGTVSDAGADGFTLVTPAGATRVTTTGTTVVTLSGASLDPLQDGASTLAVGYAGGNGR